MRLKRFISSSLVLGILLNSVLSPISSFAGVLSEDGRYETFQEDNMTINNILEEDEVDVEIEGDTIINHVNLKEFYSNGDRSAITINLDDVVINNPSIWSKAYYYFNLKPDSTYTWVVDANNSMDSNVASYIRFNHDIYSKDVMTATLFNSGEKATKIKVFTTRDTGEVCLSLESPNSVGTVTYSNIMLLEGDWTNKRIPDYFKGMKSVGELENNKLNIISQNKNLINLNIYKDANVENDGIIQVLSDGIKITTPKTTSDHVDCYMNVGVDASKSWFKRDFTKYAIPIKPDTKYTLSYNIEVESVNNHDAYIEFRDSNYNQLKMHGYTSSNIENKFTVMSPTNARYVVVRFDNNLGGNSLVFKNIQFEESSEKNIYKKYVEDKKEIELKEPLRALPNGVKDKIIKKNGQWVVERRTSQIVLDGSDDEQWYMHGLYSRFGEIPLIEGPIYSAKNDSFIYNDDIRLNNTHNSIGFRTTHCFDDYYGIRIKPYEKDDMTLKELKDYLKDNPVTIIYQLPNVIYEPLKVSSTISLFEETTHISTNSIIPTNLKVRVDRVMNRAVEYTDLAKTNPTIENISLARMWTNLVKESIKKDQLQEEVNSITNLNDMELERKNVTSNLDVYIKSENILIMSLSTNNITFEDFSGVEDMVKENAVSISINSSLPYQLNAYLPTEIQNSDKSLVMDKSILNIKENSENTYQTFPNTIDKIILKDNNTAGNDLIHNIDIKLKGGIAHQKDVYKTTIKFEAEQK